MKTFMTGLLSLFFLNSCTKTIYSHQDVIEKQRTKDDVIRQFGVPTEKYEENGFTQYVYNYGSTSIGSSYGRSNTNASVTAGNNSLYGSANTTAFAFGRVSTYSNYAKFVFDSNDRLIRWETKGVDFAEKKPAPLKTALGILVCLGTGVALALATSSGGY